MRIGRIFSFKIILFIGLCMGVSTAQAASYYLDQSNDLTDDVNYLMVTINQGDWNATTGDYDVDFAVYVLTENFPGPVDDTFGMKSFAFNFDNSITADNLTDFNPDSWTVKKTDSNISEFGKFEFELDGGGQNKTELLTFSIAVAGDSAANYAVSFGNTDGEYFAAHVAGFADTELTDGRIVDSAWFAGSTEVPVPSAAYLLGSGLIFMVGLRRRKKK